MRNNLTRRSFLEVVSVGAGAATITGSSIHGKPGTPGSAGTAGKPALLGGTPVRTKPFPSWPIIEENDRKTWQEVLEAKHWNRGKHVSQFEKDWAEQLGARYALATSSGTSALYTSLFALDIGPGDEVIVPPYTFVATINVVLLHHAVPVFVDSDRSTFQIDASKIEEAITDKTRCIIPVHLGGNVADMKAIMEISRKTGIPILEDACQSHLAEWEGKKVGTIGDLGCFSFQASKNLNSGEGGAITTNRGDLMAVCASFHNAGRGYAINPQGDLVGDDSSGFTYVRNGDNRRMTEFQGAIIGEQLTRLESQAKQRERNADYLTGMLNEIEGIEPARMYQGTTRNAYHLYMFRYDSSAFSGLSRAQFIKAMEAEGIPCSSGYGRLNKEPFLESTLQGRAFKKFFSPAEFSNWKERNHCPENDRLCDEAVWLIQTQLLGPKSDMDDIASAIVKIQEHAAELA